MVSEHEQYCIVWGTDNSKKMSLNRARYFLTCRTLVLVFFFSEIIDCLEVSDFMVKTPMWDILDENGKSVVEHFNERLTDFSAGNLKCDRYCVRPNLVGGEVPQVLHLIWRLQNGYKPGSATPSPFDENLGWERMQNGPKLKYAKDEENECTFSIIAGCKILSDCGSDCNILEENFMKYLHLDTVNPKNILKNSLSIVNVNSDDTGDSMKRKKASFSIPSNQAGMSINILGNVTTMDLKIPLGSNIENSVPEFMLTSTPLSSEISRLYLKVLKPPSGLWKLEVEGTVKKSSEVFVTSAAAEKIPKDDIGAPSSSNEETKNQAQNSFIPKKIIADRKIGQTALVYGTESFLDSSLRMGRDVYYQLQDSEELQEIPSESAVSNVESYNDNITLRMSANSIQERIFDHQTSTIDLSRLNNDELPMKKYLTVEINPNTRLIANPGEIREVIFDITNDRDIPVNHYCEVESTFRLASLQFHRILINPGQTYSLSIGVAIPHITNPAVSKVTLKVRGVETIEKSANIYVKTSGDRVNDDTKPHVDYYFNNNCPSRLHGEKCLKSYWSVDIIVQDSDMGLKSVVSSPRGIYVRSQYISGTSSPVHFYYSSNCCNKIVRVTAVDADGNSHTRDIDVDEWSNLSVSEVVAIILSILLIAALIALIVISIIYCYKRRKSQDLPFSQRYGSVSSPRTET
ncbi:hypothetical protein QAD02_024455 [Eretmocerus hayati]|uniref:Uncharacterized protein n=1 Tax=Eretmocerus hayati TaxID=131215 RepID=A0ACC2PYG5_9HYME|nr:hypothetical protein QAD02_024455 [Eretmocerus hayati]